MLRLALRRLVVPGVTACTTLPSIRRTTATAAAQSAPAPSHGQAAAAPRSAAKPKRVPLTPAFVEKTIAAAIDEVFLSLSPSDLSSRRASIRHAAGRMLLDAHHSERERVDGAHDAPYKANDGRRRQNEAQ